MSVKLKRAKETEQNENDKLTRIISDSNGICMNLCCFLMVLFALLETWCSIAGDLSEDAVMKMEKQQHLLLSASSPAISKTMTD